ncbi:hypothetical protein [Methylobacterium durans]|uniref:Uncharacterized protein n=1 Tax=Methylobacterium durans TaxID=2202825 RepID=A0A2U8W5T2_9HYPH|nr:hypothetical protein [Methylobacterium durans]AWN40880.1 hypothetical protein DK389_10515 [Methylobacterium durans]
MDEFPRRAGGPAPVTPDGRYIVVRGRLWRRANPDLAEERREALVHALMAARRAVRDAKAAQRRGEAQASAKLAAARSAVDAAKVGLGERGPVWWRDGAPDENRRLARSTGYAAWYAGLKFEAAEPDDPVSGGGRRR